MQVFLIILLVLKAVFVTELGDLPVRITDLTGRGY